MAYAPKLYHPAMPSTPRVEPGSSWEAEDLARLQTSLRAQFAALAGDEVLFENAGGSQVPDSVPQAIMKFMEEAYVQVGASSRASRIATETYDRAHAFAKSMRRFMSSW